MFIGLISDSYVYSIVSSEVVEEPCGEHLSLAQRARSKYTPCLLRKQIYEHSFYILHRVQGSMPNKAGIVCRFD